MILKKVLWKLMIIGFLSLTIGCRQDSFRRVTATDLNRYENNNHVVWTNADSSLTLIPMINNGPFLQDYNILLVLRYSTGKDAVYYLLKDTDNGNYIVQNNKLHIYDRAIGMPGVKEGWYCTTKDHSRIIDSVFFTGDSILADCPNLKYFDKIAKEKPYGIYKIDQDTLKVIAKNKQDEKKYLENRRAPGFYYFSAPGLGLERVYDLLSIEEKLKKTVTSTLEPTYYF